MYGRFWVITEEVYHKKEQPRTGVVGLLLPFRLLGQLRVMPPCVEFWRVDQADVDTLKRTSSGLFIHLKSAIPIGNQTSTAFITGLHVTSCCIGA